MAVDVNMLVLNGPPQSFNPYVINTTPNTIMAHFNLMSLQGFYPDIACKLAALIGVYNLRFSISLYCRF